MSRIRTIVREVYGLFVDDGSFAASILIWLGLIWVATPHLNLLAKWGGPILLAGLCLILIESAVRKAKGHKATGSTL
jgi:hypothetical protein